MQNTPFRFGPQSLQNAWTALLGAGTTTGGVVDETTFDATRYSNLYILLRHIRVVECTGATQTFSLCIGASGTYASGTEFGFYNYQLSGYTQVDWYGLMRLDVGEFLNAIASVNPGVTIQGEGEIGVV